MTVSDVTDFSTVRLVYCIAMFDTFYFESQIDFCNWKRLVSDAAQVTTW